MIRVHFSFLLLLSSTLGFAQTATTTGGKESARIEILNADRGEFDERIAPGAQRLKGNVRFKHKDAIMSCDSAYLYQDQRVEAFGHVAIDQADTLHVQADRCNYNGSERTARLEGNVLLRNSDMVLTTPALDYDLRNHRAVYTNGGTIVSKAGNNTLTSAMGTYITDARLFIFSHDVRLTHPERTITADTMHYATASGVASFFGPTEIVQLAKDGDSTQNSVIHTTRGTYDTKNEKARFSKRSNILSKGRTLEGDSLHYDRKTGMGLAWGDVLVTDSTGEMTVKGAVGLYNELTEQATITGRAELWMVSEADTLFLHADTLFTMPDSSGKRIHARRNVRFFRTDMQGVCDTLVYSEADSMIRMFHQPILWSGTDQITGNHIRITLHGGKADKLFVEKNAFLMSEVDTIGFDQVAGTDLTGYFGEDGLRSLLVEGNSRTVYYAKETKDGKESILGVNRADCSRINVLLTGGKVSTVTFLDRPDAILYPLEKVPPDELRMKGSDWHVEERPLDRNGIFAE